MDADLSDGWTDCAGHERAYSYLKASILYYSFEVDDLTNYDFHLCSVWLWGFLLNENLFCHFSFEKIYAVSICVVYFWVFTFRHRPSTINLYFCGHPFSASPLPLFIKAEQTQA